MEAHAKKAVEKAVPESIAEIASGSRRPPSGPPPTTVSFADGPGSPSSPPISPECDQEQPGRQGPWSTRAAGGDVGDGMYVVNEMGPEAFIEGRDVGKLRCSPAGHLRADPQGQRRRPDGHDRPASWSMFAPQKDGLIVRREDAHAALGAVHAADGIVLPGHFGGRGAAEVSAGPGAGLTTPLCRPCGRPPARSGAGAIQAG